MKDYISECYREPPEQTVDCQAKCVPLSVLPRMPPGFPRHFFNEVSLGKPLDL